MAKYLPTHKYQILAQLCCKIPATTRNIRQKLFLHIDDSVPLYCLGRGWQRVCAYKLSERVKLILIQSNPMQQSDGTLHIATDALVSYQLLQWNTAKVKHQMKINLPNYLFPSFLQLSYFLITLLYCGKFVWAILCLTRL